MHAAATYVDFLSRVDALRCTNSRRSSSWSERRRKPPRPPRWLSARQAIRRHR